MRIRFSVLLFTSVCGLILFAKVSAAQTSVQLFGPVDTATSLTSAAYDVTSTQMPDVYNSTTVTLTCGASPSVQLSGPLTSNGLPVYSPSGAVQPGGNLIVDNNLLITDTVGGVAGTQANVCTQGLTQSTANPPTYTDPNGVVWAVPPIEEQNCFQNAYASYATSSGASYATTSPLLGQDPDTFVIPSGFQGAGQTVAAAGGVPQIDISTYLTASIQQSLNIQLVDDGGIRTSSTIFLTTNCTINGVTGGTVSGNPINGSNGANQHLPFNSVNNENVSLTYNVTGALPNLIANQTGSSPMANDLGVDPSLFQKNFVSQTSFATSNCFIHSGELLTGELLPGGGLNPNPAPACKLYTLVCTNQTLSAAAGALCPISSQANEVIAESFDGPNTFSLPNIYTPFGINREGIGFLMASDTWLGMAPNNPGGNCLFDTASNLEALPCPQNLLNSFTGPGGFGSSGETTNPNSTFISVYGVPEDFTTVLVAGEWPDNWVNTNALKAYFFSQPPNFTKGAYTLTGGKLTALPNATKYIPQPIKSISYGITSPGDTAPNPINEPISYDTPLVNSATTCPHGALTATSEPNFDPPPVTLDLGADGKYLLHYYAEDCAGTQELQFTQAPGTGSWSTSFFTYPVNVDTVKPVVVGLTLSAPNGTGKNAGTYNSNTTVTATYSCTDAGQGLDGAPNTGSGVVLCGTNIYGPETTYNTGTLTTKFNVGGAGKSKTFTIYTADGAGNINSAPVTYTVN